MMLFAGEPLPPQTEQAHQNGTVEPAFTGQVFMTEDELLAISARLDELAGRVEELLGIS